MVLRIVGAGTTKHCPCLWRCSMIISLVLLVIGLLSFAHFTRHRGAITGGIGVICLFAAFWAFVGSQVG